MLDKYSTVKTPGTIAYWQAMEQAYTAINLLKVYFAEMMELEQAGTDYNVDEIRADIEGDATLADEFWKDTPYFKAYMETWTSAEFRVNQAIAKFENSVKEISSNEMFWNILWAQKNEFIFRLIEAYVEGTKSYRMYFGKTSGSLHICGQYAIAQSKDGSFELQDHNYREGMTFFSGSFQNVLDKANEIFSSSNTDPTLQ